MAAIFKQNSDGSRKKFLVEKDEVVIGRGSDADIVIDDGLASRRHCSIIHKGGRYTLRDLGSRNGTFHNNVQIKEVELGYNDKFRIGTTYFGFHPNAGKGNTTLMREVSGEANKGKGMHTIMRELSAEIAAKKRK